MIPRPFGMRWFGIFAIYCIVWTAFGLAHTDNAQKSALINVFGGIGFLALALLMISLCELSDRIKDWLFEDWL